MGKKSALALITSSSIVEGKVRLATRTSFSVVGKKVPLARESLLESFRSASAVSIDRLFRLLRENLKIREANRMSWQDFAMQCV